MDAITPGTNRSIFKNIFRKKKTVAIISICLAAVLIAGGVLIFIRVKNSKSVGTAAQRTTKVIKGRLVDTIAGSAPIESSYRSELSPKVTATLKQINCKEGDQVKAGDVLFVLDNTDAQLNIENAKNNIAQMELTLDSTAKSVNGLTVKAPYGGRITDVNVKEGDAVNKGGALFTITDVSSVTVTLPFSGAAIEDVAIGQSASVYIQDLMLSVEGTVSYKSGKPYTTASGGQLYNVEITIENPGALNEGMKATAEITAGGTSLKSVDSGTLSYADTTVLKSDAGGTIKSLNVRENEFVNAGDILVELENEDLLLTSTTDEIKMENLRSQLEIQQKQLEYYTITAPFDGTITKLGSANEGDTVKQGDVLAVVSDMSHLKFSVAIDELDISQLAVGQKVSITADALEETATEPLSGKVSGIAMEGTSSNGVTTYPVTVTVDDESVGKLKTGMNIDAEIYISDKSDVLMVPVEAVVKMGDKSFVYVKSSAQGEASQESKAAGAWQQGQWPGRQGQEGQPAAQEGTAQAGGSSRTGQPGGQETAGQSGEAAGGQTGQSGAPTQRQAGQAAGQETAEQSGEAANGQVEQSGENTQSGQSAESEQSAQSGDASGETSKRTFSGTTRRTGSSNPYYDGAVLTEVETGISNDTYIEIVSGLTEGQEIVLPQTSTSTNTSTTDQRNQGGGMMGGNMPFSGGGAGAVRMERGGF